MNAAERRTKITHLLAQANGPLSATALAAQCGVSRQIIVGDVALLRAGGLAVLATPRGYILENTSAPACAERHMSAITTTAACLRSYTRSSISAEP